MKALGAKIDSAHARLLAHASVVGALAVVPLPWLPELVQVAARRRLVATIAAEKRVHLSPAALRLLADALGPTDSAATGLLSRRFLAARIARRVKLIAVIPALEAAMTLAAGGLLLDRAFERGEEEGGPMTDAEARRIQRVIRAALEAFARPDAMEEVLRQTGALDDGVGFAERVNRALRGTPAEALRVLRGRFDEGWEAL